MLTRDWKDYLRNMVAADPKIAVDPPNVITGVINVPQLVLPDEQGKRDIAFRLIQNTGAVDLYYTFGFDKPNQGTKVYHGKIPVGATQDFSMCDKAVYVTSSTGAYEAAPCIGVRI
jgi:hypothetical protein